MCTRIAIDPANADRVYVTFGGFAKDNVWTTTDGGQNWACIGASLPEVPVYCVTVHPKKSDFIYIGTTVGVFGSENAGLVWSATNEGPTNCPVYDLFWMNSTLIAATHGRGMFKIDLK
jgi:hypothetical protein